MYEVLQQLKSGREVVICFSYDRASAADIAYAMNSGHRDLIFEWREVVL